MSYVVKIVYSSVGNDGPLSPSFSVPLLELSLIEITDNSPWVSSWQDGKYRKACSLKAVSLVDLVEAMTRFGNQIPQNLEYGHESTLKHDHKMRLCSAILPIFSGLKELARMVPHFMANQLGLHGRIGKLKMPGPRGHFKVGQKPRQHPHHFSRGSSWRLPVLRAFLETRFWNPSSLFCLAGENSFKGPLVLPGLFLGHIARASTDKTLCWHAASLGYILVLVHGYTGSML